MKQAVTLAVVFFAIAALHAQAPSNDDFDCGTMVNLGLAPACQPTVYTNRNATPSVIATDDEVSCFNSGAAQRDVWFRFQCPISLLDVRVTVAGAGAMPITNPEFAIFRGDCVFDGTAELDCISAGQGQTSVYLDLFGLTPGVNYYVRVSDWSPTAAPNWGDFTICVDSIPPVVNITQGSSSLCSGTLYDSGGEFGDYGPNENHTFVICPDQPAKCITFTLDFYNLEPTANPFGSGQGDQLYFYDGSSTSSPLLAALDGAGFSQQNIAGGGGVCFMVQATSGCLTVRFQSNGSVQQEGWKGTWVCSSNACEPVETLKVDTSITHADIVAAISTGGAVVTVTDIFCDPVQYGTFKFATENNPLNMEKGLLLTSGRATNAQGPNTLTGAGTALAPFNDPGDPDLNYLSIAFGGGSLSRDACIVELDVFAATNEVVFEYVFGSEEYPEYIFSTGGFNDIFAFLVSGPGITGDPNLTNSALNIAVLPNASKTLVQIDSVNNQANWQYYRNNELSQSIQYDGLTSDFMGVKKSLTARVPVIPCNTYHLKLAIADRGDESFDSGVFVSEIKAGSPEIKIKFASGVNYFIENCTGDKDTLFIQLSQPPTAPTTFNLSLGGTAELGLDYLLDLPPSITFQPGQTTVAFPIVPLADALAEGTETILINISRDYGCGEVVLKTLVAEINDGVVVNVTGGDTLTVCKNDFLQLQASGANTYFWQPTNAVSNPYIAAPVTSPLSSLWLTVTGFVGDCQDTDSVFVRVIAPSIIASATTPANICLGGSVQLQAVVDPVGTPVTWFPNFAISDPNSLTPTVSPTFPITYTASATVDGCTVNSSVTVLVDTLRFPQIIGDTILCQNYPVLLAAPLSSTTQYEWTPADGLSNPNIAAPIATPDETTTYTLTATSKNNACSQTASVTVEIIPADVDILGPELRLLCLGDTAFLHTSASPAGSAVTWSPPFYVSAPSGPSVFSVPDESVTITATYVVNGCLVRDSVRLKVDSLPDLSIRKVLDKEVYCPGDTIYFLSNIYEPANFPGITHEWEPFGTFLTSEKNWNLVVLASDTFTYKRVSRIGGCVDTGKVFVPVFIPPTVTATAQPPIICPGETSQITVAVNPQKPEYQYEWSEQSSATLSCNNCLTPTAFPTQTEFYQITVKDLPCPAGATVAVFVENPPVLQLANDPVICSEGSVKLNNNSQLDVTYTWSPPDFLDNPNSAMPTATPTKTVTYYVVAQGPKCKTEGSVTVSYFDASVELGPDQVICEGQSAVLTASVKGDPGTFFWQPTGETTPSIAVSPTSLTEYSVYYDYGKGCRDSASVQIDVIPLPVLNLNPNTMICRGESVNLTLPPNGPGSFQWSPPTFLNNASIPNPIATPTQTTTYQVTATNQNCPPVQGSVTVEVASAAVSAGADQTICFGQSATLTAEVTGTPAQVITWAPGNFTGPSVTVAPPITQTYTVRIEYGVNCTDEDQVTVKVNPPVLLTFAAVAPEPRDSICEGVKVKLKAGLLPGSAQPSSYQWLLNGAPIPGATLDSLEATPQGAQSTYSVVATSANGCSATSEGITFMTKRCFAIPNAFTPNGDGANDAFGPIFFGGTGTVVRFQVFNRWGQMVYEGSGDKPTWDGRSNGTEAPSDVYVYVMRVRFGNGDEEDYHGEVTLLR